MSYPNYVLNDIISKLEYRKGQATDSDDISFYDEALPCLHDVNTDLQDNSEEIDRLEQKVEDLEGEIDDLEDQLDDVDWEEDDE